MTTSRYNPPQMDAAPTGTPLFFESFPIIISRLSFRTNSHTIVPFLLSKKGHTARQPAFTLNAVVELPENLIIPKTPMVIDLSLKNAALPILDETVRSGVVACLAPHYQSRLSPPALGEAVALARRELENGQLGNFEQDALQRALDNHQQYGFFSQIDWCLDHWGCPEDIIGVVEETFTVPTPQLEFTTLASPPILALQLLSNTFPSVRFTLQYTALNCPTWTEVEFHPFPPFGY